MSGTVVLCSHCLEPVEDGEALGLGSDHGVLAYVHPSCADSFDVDGPEVGVWGVVERSENPVLHVLTPQGLAVMRAQRRRAVAT